MTKKGKKKRAQASKSAAEQSSTSQGSDDHPEQASTSAQQSSVPSGDQSQAQQQSSGVGGDIVRGAGRGAGRGAARDQGEAQQGMQPQRPGGQPQQQRPGGQPQQQQPGGQPQQQRPGDQPQQQRSGGQPQQQRPGDQPQQRQAWGRPSQQPSADVPSTSQTAQPTLPQQQPDKQQTHAPTSSSKTQVKETRKPQAKPMAGELEPSVRHSDVVKAKIPSDLALQYMLQIPRRKNPLRGGTLGTPITVETNMLRINFNSNFKTNITHYDVEFSPDRPKFLFRPIFEEFRKKHFPNRYPAFDGKKNAYSAGDLPFGTYLYDDDVTVYDPERETQRTFKIELNKVQVYDLSWLKSIKPGSEDYEKNQVGLQVLDVILRHGPASKYIPVCRSLFQPPTGRVVSLSNGLDLWVGIFQSAVVGWKPYLNVDVAHKGFPKSQNVVDLMREMCAKRQDDRSQGDIDPRDVRRNQEDISNFLQGLKVQYEIPGRPGSKRVQRVNGLSESARTKMFTSDGKKISVQQYFQREKGYNIRYPDLPCIWVGSREKDICLPAELCTIVAGQAVQKKLDKTQTDNMIRHAATSTTQRKEKIMNIFKSMSINNYPTMTKEFNLSVHGEFETVPARVLPAPKLMYDKETSVQRGTWRAGKFMRPCALEDGSWTILNLNSYVQERDLYALHDALQGGGRSVGMQIGAAEKPFGNLDIQRGNIAPILQYFTQKKDKGIKLVVVIIPDRTDDAYSKVKQITELKVGVLTQCIKQQTMRKLSPATVGNILLKINSKLNGVNHTFVPAARPKCLEVPTMLVGADVTHPSPGAIGIPSIAAVAASHDPKAFQYNVEIRLQPAKTEIIQDLENIMRSQLLFFYTSTRHKPQKIIFYRDGVSEGDLPRVMHFELTALKNAFRKLGDGTYRPSVTFLVVQKRHHTRLFPTNPRDSDDAQRNFNVKAGTIVDTQITHPTDIDFYLVSHASIQGTARPTKYRCICDENNFSEDELEQLTYYLCHMFARCTRSVSYPAPTYYAHLAAFRGRALTHNVRIEMNNLEEEQRTKLTVTLKNSRPMYFV